MEEKGLPRDVILEELEKRLGNDLTYESGRILGSMCTLPHEFAMEVFVKYAYKNLGDPGLFPGTLALERELIEDLGKLFGGNNITGSMVTGGSEANVIALRIAKKLNPGVKHPEVVCSANAHMSFYKAADFMGLTIRTAGLTNDFQPDMDHYRSLINSNTIALVGIAGTTSLGLVEPIDEIAELAEQHDLFLHIDAAFGGFVLPFMEDMGYKFTPYDFRVKAVGSLTADPHKMGMGLIPGGGFLVRSEILTDSLHFSIPYLAGGGFKHLTITGTRSGGTVIAFWALMKYLGREGFRKVVKRCYENTLYLKKRIEEIEGIAVAHDPVINIIGIKTVAPIPHSICKIDEMLRRKGWAMGVFRKLNIARIVVMPHIKREHLEEFADDLEKVVKTILAR